MNLSPWGWAALGIIALLVLVIWSIRRHRNPILQVRSDAGIAALVPSLAGLTLGTPVPGNAVVLHENGAYFDVLLERIAAARQSVHFEMYLWKDGELGRRVAAALAERARAGVPVRVLLDAQGSRRAGDDTLERLREAGCHVRFFHKWSIYQLGLVNDRDHRKLVVIDGREAFVGGHCIVDDWLGDAEDHRHFADVSLQLRGPIVHGIQACFSENWAGETGELFVGDAVFPALEPAGDTLAHAVFLKPESSAPAVKILHHTALCLARERIWIQNPYFIPEPEAIDAMGAAVKRGVDVRVLVPAVSGSDNPIVQHAGHRNFQKLLECGVRLFEYPHTLLHQKVMTIDGHYCAVGSTNFDDRSFDTNDEISLGLLDARLARQLDGIFEKYAARATELTLEQWRRRAWWERLRDQVFYFFNELL